MMIRNNIEHFSFVRTNTLGASHKGHRRKSKKKNFLKRLFSGSTSQDNLGTILNVDSKPYQVSETETQINQSLSTATFSLGLALAGTLIHPLFNLFSLAALSYMSITFFKNAYQTFLQTRKISLAIVDMVGFAAPLLMGYYAASAIYFLIYYWGRKLLVKTQDQSKKSLDNIFAVQPRQVWLLENDVQVEVPFDSLQIGDVILAYAGETIPVDGVITNGYASIDQRALTGESQPAEKKTGDRVLTSTIVLSGHVAIEVEQMGQETVAAEIGHLLNHATDYRTSIQSRVYHLSGLAVRSQPSGHPLVSICVSPLLLVY